MDTKIIAVDFDGTLCENKWPEIGEPNHKMITYLKKRQAAGDKLILWSCRVGDILEEAINWSKEQGIIFDAVNENLPEIVESFGTNTRKIFADEYIDDRNFEFMSQPDRVEFVGNLIDVVEDWLTEKCITAEDEPSVTFMCHMEGANADTEDVGDAFIFGADYDYLADRFAAVIGISRECSEEE